MNKNERKAIMEADRQFSKLSNLKGAAIAFDSFISDDVIRLVNRSNPLRGRRAVVEDVKKMGGTLRWEPFFADTSESCDLGYTVGDYEYIYLDQMGYEKTSRGNYITIWKKSVNGEWKVVFDTGTVKE